MVSVLKYRKAGRETAVRIRRDEERGKKLGEGWDCKGDQGGKDGGKRGAGEEKKGGFQFP